MIAEKVLLQVIILWRKVMLPNQIKVIISDEDIKQGKRGKYEECPLALAIKKLYPEFLVVVLPRMFDGAVCIHDKNGLIVCRYHLDVYDGEAIVKYDNGGEFDLKEVILTKCK